MNCVICLPVKNCEKHLLNVFSNLLIINQLFIKTSIIFGYDNSKDNSLKLLHTFKNSNKHIDIVILENTQKPHKYRTHNLEYIRNWMLEIVHERYSHYNYYITIDSDDVCATPIDINILKKHIDNETNWDVLSFNKPSYYDIWALQYDIFVHHFRCLSYNSNPVICYIRDDIKNKLNNLNENEYFQVHSAFNGFGIYKLKYLKNIKYDGKTQYYFSTEKVQHMIDYLNNHVKNKRKTIQITDSAENCEHIGLHISMINKYNDVKIMVTKDILFN
mgnify:CR=1 FL=1|jgi:hypothetical protein